ncbi:MAG TPA: sigma-54 dependent transcriptional regulator [Planctomycetota bacterium]|jgi:DNA-binding NtrC family response regulator
MREHIVIIDDEPNVLELEADLLSSLDVTIRKFTDPVAAWDHLQCEKTSLVITDWMMPGLTGLDLLFKTRGLAQPPYVIIITAFGTVERAVQAMNAGAFNFLCKPFEQDTFRTVVRQALEQRVRQTASFTPVKAVRASQRITVPIAKSAVMHEVLELVRSAAQSESSLLLLGESGTGKEVLADFVHANSRRAAGPIVKVNCGALPEHLMESELFGHEKGAFTGADKRVIGRFEQASGGTLFLDEIGDLLPHLQVKLLRALQDHVIERVGSGAPVSVDFRLICATHRDLRAAVAENRFREDLYYRINVVPINVPPLRNRADDIEPLAAHFLKTLGGTLQNPPTGFSTEAIAALLAFRWPGNVRQLRNAIEYALVMCKQPTIDVSDLPAEMRECLPANAAQPALAEPAGASSASAPGNLKDKMDNAEASAILSALERHHWRVTAVAKELGISRSTLYLRMDALGIKRPD